MTPVDQLFLHSKEDGVVGDCWRACIASLLDLPAESVPHFMLEPCYLDATAGWPDQRGMIFHIDVFPPNELCIAVDRSPREGYHSVIADGGALEDKVPKLVHDPHPSRAGLVHKDPRYFWFVVK